MYVLLMPSSYVKVIKIGRKVSELWKIVCKNITLQPTQLFSRLTCLSLRDSKCSKWWSSNFINNLSLLILFILFPGVEIYKSVWCMDAPLKTMYSLLALVSRTQLVTSRVKNRLSLALGFPKLVSWSSSPLIFLTIPYWLKC